MIENLEPKGAKVLVEVVDKENKEDMTESGIILTAKNKDSGDNAMFCGTVLKVGMGEYDDKGHFRGIDVVEGTFVHFNRYNAFKVINKGLKTYWVVDVRDIWCVGQI